MLSLRNFKKKIGSFFLDDSRRDEYKELVDFAYFEFSRIEKENLCIFAHYNSDGIVHDYVLFYIEELRKCGFDVVLCSSSKLLESEKLKLRTSVVGILEQENYGWDFGLWKSTLLYLKKEIFGLKIRSILITNDSVYGPIADLKLIFDEMNFRGSDFWGMTASLENCRHLQSYFIMFNKKVIQSLYFWTFWNNVKYCFDKRTVIENYELRLEMSFVEQGFKSDSYFSFQKFLDSKDKDTRAQSFFLESNPTLKFWENLIYKFNFPFIKGELLRKRMITQEQEIQLRGFLSSSMYPLAMIDDHLRSNR